MTTISVDLPRYNLTNHLGAILLLVAAICTIQFSSNAMAATSCVGCTITSVGLSDTNGVYYVSTAKARGRVLSHVLHRTCKVSQCRDLI